MLCCTLQPYSLVELDASSSVSFIPWPWLRLRPDLPKSRLGRVETLIREATGAKEPTKWRGDPEHFRTILNFLRNPQTPPMPRDLAESEALVQDGKALRHLRSE